MRARHIVLWVVVASWSAVGFASCKAPEIDEGWARSVVVAHAAELGLLEQNLDRALRAYARAEGGSPEEKAAKLDRDVEVALRDAKWFTGWAPIELVAEGDDARSGARAVPFNPPKSVEGGSRRTKGVSIGPNRRLYWGRFDVGGEVRGGAEVLTSLKKDDLTLNVRIFVVPGAPRVEP